MFDALTARAIAAELNEKVGRGRVQAVLPLSGLEVGLEIYARHARHYLLASADPVAARLVLTPEKLRASGETPDSFVLLLKKYLRGAFLNRAIADPRERIIRLEFDHAEYGVTVLVAEIMGRLSNLILVDATGMVLDAIKRVTPAMSRARAVLPARLYQPPPPQNKVDPLTVTAEELALLNEQEAGLPLWQALVRTVAGTSPLLAREIAFRVAGNADAPVEAALAGAVREQLVRVWSEPPEPTLAYEEGEPSAVAAFALTHLPNTERLDSMSEALAQFFGQMESYAAVKEPLRRELEEALGRLERKRAALERELTAEAEVERLKTSGEMILAYQHQIAPGQKVLAAEMLEGEPLKIRLDPNLTPLENAQKYFAEYRRAQGAAATVPARLAEAEADIAFAEQVILDLEAAESRAEIDAVAAEAREAGLVSGSRAPRRTALPSGPRTFTSPDGIEVLVGRNARQNEQVTFERAGPEDLWLHARGLAGAHVVILGHGNPVPQSTIEFAAGLAAFYSKGRTDTRVDVVVTPRKNVRRVKGRGAHPGLVTVRDERTVRVRPARPEE